MDFQSLRTVLLIEQLGSIAAAARRLNVDASSISRVLAGVERELGMRLFQRSTRRLQVSEAGAAYLRRIAPLLDEMEAARTDASQHSTSPRGHLRITASVAFSHEMIVPLLAGFTAAYPEISVELLATDSNLNLLDEDVDLAIRLAAAPRGDLISTRLMRTRYRVVAAPGEPLRHPRELAGRDCLRLALPGFQERWHFRQEQTPPFSVPISGPVQIANPLALRAAALQSQSPALLPDWLVSRDLAARRLVDLLPDWDCTATEFDTGAYLLYPSRSYLPGKTRAAIDFFRSGLQQPSTEEKNSQL